MPRTGKSKSRAKETSKKNLKNNTRNKTKTGGKPKKRRLFLKIFLLLLLGLGCYTAYFFLTLPDVVYLKKKNPGTTAIIQQRQSEAEKEGKALVIRRRWVSFKRIPILLKHAVRISEDAAFYQHKGIDYHELKEAVKRNLKEGRIVRGASTITQQLAKNLFLSTQKSYFRKFREFFITKRLEKHLTKDRIFSLYLNIIEFGHGIFGVGEAARHFFKKPVDRLTLAETVRLVSVIPKPLRVSPLSNSEYLKWRSNLLLDRLKRYGYINSSQYRRAKSRFR